MLKLKARQGPLTSSVKPVRPDVLAPYDASGVRTPERRRGWRMSVVAGVVLVGALTVPGVSSASAPDGASSEGRCSAAGVAVGNHLAARVVNAQPRNGAVLLKRGSGRGQLAVDNSRNDSDTVVTLARPGRAVLVMYVRAGSRAQAGGVPDGVFDVYAERGRNWDRAAGRFTESPTFARLDRSAEFRTESKGRSIRYSKVSLTLYGVVNGNTQLQPVAESAVPS